MWLLLFVNDVELADFVLSITGKFFTSWNVSGFGTLLRDSSAMGILKKSVIFCIQETMLMKKVSICGFKLFQRFAKKLNPGRGRPSGGLITGIKEGLNCKLSEIDLLNDDVLWISVSFQNLKLAIGNVYRRPSNDKLSLTCFFQLLRDQIDTLESENYDVILAGDFNIRIGSSTNPTVVGTHAASLIPVASLDTTISPGAEEFWSFLSDCNFRILNGMNGDTVGFTYVFLDKRSTIDFVISGTRSQHLILDCNVVHEIDSVHLPVVAILNQDLRTEELISRLPKTKKVVVSMDVESIKTFFEIYSTEADIDDFIAFSSHFVNTEVVILEDRHDERSSQEYSKAKILRREARSALKTFQRDGLKTSHLVYWEKRMSWYRAIRDWKSNKDKYFRSKFAKVLENRHNDARQMWRMIKGKVSRVSECAIPIKTWLDHFSSLLYFPQARKFVFRPRGVTSHVLDCPLQSVEIDARLNDRPYGKRGGPDNLDVSFWKSAFQLSEVQSWLQFNFRKFLAGEKLPETWSEGEIMLLFKNKGMKTDPNCWRGISLTNELLKLFESILARRITIWAEENLNLFCQTAFRKSYSVLEHAVSLECMIRNLGNGEKLYVALMDLCKAFPSIDRCLLLEKLQNMGLSDMVMKCLANLYSDDNFTIIYDGENSEKFTVNRGLKEGSCLSPILFLLFVSDLPECMSRVSGSFPIVGGGEIRCLQFADDVVLVAKDKSSLQALVHEFESYCRTNSLSINPKKTEFLTFPSSSTRDQIQVGNETVKVCKRARYLGIIFMSGSCRKGHPESRLTAAKLSMSSMVASCLKLGLSDVKLFCDILRSCVVSTLTYGIFIQIPHPKILELSTMYVRSFRKSVRLPCSVPQKMVLRLTNSPCFECIVMIDLVRYLCQVLFRSTHSIALASIRDLWEQERLREYRREDAWRTRNFLSELISWLEKRLPDSSFDTWEDFLRVLRKAIPLCESPSSFRICQDTCNCNFPRTESEFFFETCCDITRDAPFWQPIRLICEESRLTMLFVCNHWRYSNTFARYSFVSKFCPCCSTDTLIRDSNVHAFVCSALSIARQEALEKVELVQNAMLTNCLSFDKYAFAKCLNNEDLVPIAYDFVTTFFEVRRSAWDQLAKELVQILR